MVRALSKKKKEFTDSASREWMGICRLGRPVSNVPAPSPGKPASPIDATKITELLFRLSCEWRHVRPIAELI